MLPGYLNTPVVTLTVCVPGTSNCQTIDNILLDTGSVGLRLAHGVLSFPLPQLTTSGGQYVYECLQFATGDNFGPVVTADISLGGEPTLQSFAVQVSNSSLTPPSSCSSLAPFSLSGINGILGVGYPFTQYDQGNYYSCNTPLTGCSSYSSYSPSSTPSTMVSNPIFSLPSDNNGILVTFPSISSGGADNVYGTLTFGLNTQTDNSTSGLTTYNVHTSNSTCGQSLFLSATFTGSSGSSCAFLDTGSNGLFFGTSTFPLCMSNQWYCPSLSAPITFSPSGANGSSGTFSLLVLDFNTINNSPYPAWNDAAGPYSANNDSTFDAGLPFFFGRTVAVGFSVNGQTPFWAF